MQFHSCRVSCRFSSEVSWLATDGGRILDERAYGSHLPRQFIISYLAIQRAKGEVVWCQGVTGIGTKSILSKDVSE